MATASHEIGGKITKALGLKNARSIEIRFAVNEIATVKAEIMSEKGELDEVSQILSEYGFVAAGSNPVRHAIRNIIDQIRRSENS